MAATYDIRPAVAATPAGSAARARASAPRGTPRDDAAYAVVTPDCPRPNSVDASTHAGDAC
jgi:hypothetical protein